MGNEMCNYARLIGVTYATKVSPCNYLDQVMTDMLHTIIVNQLELFTNIM